jgi:hypothetical protein
LRNYNLCVMRRKVVSLSLVPPLCVKEALHVHATTSYNDILLSIYVASYCCVLLQPIVVCCCELLQLPTTNLNHPIGCCFIVDVANSYELMFCCVLPPFDFAYANLGAWRAQTWMWTFTLNIFLFLFFKVSFLFFWFFS